MEPPEYDKKPSFIKFVHKGSLPLISCSLGKLVRPDMHLISSDKKLFKVHAVIMALSSIKMNEPIYSHEL